MRAFELVITNIRRSFGIFVIAATSIAFLALSGGVASADLGTGGIVWGSADYVSTNGYDVDGDSVSFDISEDGQTIVAMWARRLASGSPDFIMQMSVGTIGSGPQIVWGPVQDMGVQLGNSWPGAIAVAPDGLSVVLAYIVDPTGQSANQVVQEHRIIDPVGQANRATGNARQRTDAIPQGNFASDVSIQISDDGSKAFVMYKLVAVSGASLYTSTFDNSIQGSPWQSPSQFASLTDSGSYYEMRLSGDGNTVAVVYETQGLTGTFGGWFAQTGSIANGVTTWAQAPYQLLGADQSKNSTTEALSFEMSNDGTKAITTFKYAEGLGANSVATVVLSTGVISGSTATWSSPVTFYRSERDPAAPNFSSFVDRVSLAMSSDGSSVGIAWDRSGDDGATTYLSEIYVRVGGFSGTNFSWGGPAVQISAPGSYEYQPRLITKVDGRQMAITYEGDSGTELRMLAVDGGTANWSPPVSFPSVSNPVTQFSPTGNHIVIMSVDSGVDVQSILGVPTYPVAPTTTSTTTTTTTTAPGSSSGSNTPGSTIAGSTTVAPGSLPATGRPTNSLVMNALVVALLGATLVVVKRRLTI